MPDTKANTLQISKTGRTTWIIIASSMPFFIIILGLIKAFLSEPSGIVDTTNQQMVFYTGLYLALPFGLLNIFTGINALSKGLLSRFAAIAAIVIGGLSVIVGILAWIWFFMVSAFAAAF